MRAIASAAVILSACTTAASQEEVPVHGGAPGATCAPAKAQVLVGQPGTAALGARALELTGARSVRWIRPGNAVTMDFREDRLNIDLNAQGRVKGLRCG